MYLQNKDWLNDLELIIKIGFTDSQLIDNYFP